MNAFFSMKYVICYTILIKFKTFHFSDDAEISLSNLVKIVRFFGPIKKDKENKCILIRHVSEPQCIRTFLLPSTILMWVFLYLVG